MKITKKKIVFLISSLGGGGAERVCVNIANSFVSKGYYVELVILNLNNQVYLRHLSKDIKIIDLKVRRARYAFFNLLKYIFINKPEKILVFNYELSVVLVMIRFFFRFKLKIISRNINTISIKIDYLNQQNLWKKYIVKNLIKYFYCKIDHVINQCNEMRDDLVRLYPQLRTNSSVIYNPISCEILENIILSDINKIEKKDYLLCVGRLEKQKAFHYAIRAFAEIANEFPNLRLKILGQGSLEVELKQYAIDCGVVNKVDFEGFQRNISSYYLYARATVLTSLYEGFPNNLIESIALGTPVVSFNCSCGPSEIIKPGVNGYLVNYKDPIDLKNKLSAVIKKKFNINEMLNSVDKFKLNKISNDYEKIFTY